MVDPCKTHRPVGSCVPRWLTLQRVLVITWASRNYRISGAHGLPTGPRSLEALGDALGSMRSFVDLLQQENFRSRKWTDQPILKSIVAAPSGAMVEKGNTALTGKVRDGLALRRELHLPKWPSNCPAHHVRHTRATHVHVCRVLHLPCVESGTSPGQSPISFITQHLKPRLESRIMRLTPISFVA